MENFHFQLEKFQGPLDLLLQLLEEQRLKITDISLAQIANQYLTYIEKEKVNPESISDFLVVAARLLMIKSKEILPDLELTVEEEEDIEDFKRRLIEYQKYKALALEFKKLEKRGVHSLVREVWFADKSCFAPPPKISPRDFERAFESIRREFPQDAELEKKALKKTLSLEEKISLIKTTLQNRVRACLQELNPQGDREEVIVTFLALLELLSRQEIRAKQKRAFAKIEISAGETTPLP